MTSLGLFLAATLLSPAAPAGDDQPDRFRQLEEILPTPNRIRAASGAPGPGYWQQRADYVIHVELDDENQRIAGSESVHYVNHSPETLRYIWLQLDNNVFDPEGAGALSASAPDFGKKSRAGPCPPCPTAPWPACSSNANSTAVCT